jgi:hypothetical protein
MKAQVPPAPSSNKSKSSSPLSHFTADVHGPLVEGLRGERYILAFVDDSTKVVFAYHMKSRTDVYDSLTLFVKHVTAMRINASIQSQSSVLSHQVDLSLSDNLELNASLHTDCAKEFLSQEFAELCLQHKIALRTGSPYKHTQQAKVEIVWKDHLRKIRSLLYSAGLPSKLWPYASSHAIYIKNRLPHVSLNMLSPFEKLFGRAPDLSFLRIFGCVAYSFIDESQRSKLDPRSKKLVYIGHSDNSLSYKLIDPSFPQTIVLSGMVNFDEQNVLSGVPAKAASEENFPVLYLPDCSQPPDIEEFDHNTAAISGHKVFLNTKDLEYYGLILVSVDPLTSPAWISVHSFIMKPSRRQSQIKKAKIFLDYLTKCKETLSVNVFYPLFSIAQVCVDNVVTSATIVSMASGPHDHPFMALLHDDLSLVDVSLAQVSFPDVQNILSVGHGGVTAAYSTPSNMHQAMQAFDKDLWLAAANREFLSHKSTNTYTLIKELPHGKEALGTMLVFKVKLHPDGSIDKYKVRMCARGFLQRHGIDYKSTYSPTSNPTSLRTICILAARDKLTLWHCDVVTAFLHADLPSDVCMYIKFPSGIVVDECEYALLNKSIYGLKQAPREWHKLSHSILLESFPGLTLSSKDPSFYHLCTPTLTVFLTVHVDDYFVACEPSSWYEDVFLPTLRKHISVTDLGQATHVLGLVISQYHNSVVLSQENVILDLQERYGLEDSRPVYVPMDPNFDPPTSPQCDLSLPYRSLLGELLWIARCTRPDILYAVGKLSRYNNGYTQVHWQALLRVAKFLCTTSSQTLQFHPNCEDNLVLSC